MGECLFLLYYEYDWFDGWGGWGAAGSRSSVSAVRVTIIYPFIGGCLEFWVCLILDHVVLDYTTYPPRQPSREPQH